MMSIPQGLRRTGSPFLVTAGLAAGLAACSTGEAATDSSSALQTATVERKTIVSSVEATGTIEPIRIIEVKSQAGGEILDLRVELGDRVEQGTLLASIDPRDVRNAFEQAEADLEVATARFEVAERQLERIESLHDSDIVTDEELESAILEHANSKAALVRAQTNFELSEDKLNDVTLRAPISGTVVERAIEEGQVITGTRDLTGGTVLLRMADLGEVQVRTLVDETDIGRLEAGLQAEIRVEAYPERAFRGQVLKIEPQAVVQQNVTLFAVLTRIANENDLLRPGMNADVEIVVGRQDDVLALPTGAVKSPQEATQLARALGIEMPEGPAGRGGGLVADGGSPGADGGQARGGSSGTSGDQHADDAARPTEATGESTSDDQEIGGVAISELQSMSQEKRREWFQGLSAGERQRAMELFRGRTQAAQQNPTRGGPRAAFVFQNDAEGRLALHPIQIGLSDFDNTEIVSGLDEGDQVVSVPLSLIQQADLLERIRSRSGVPGVSRN